MTLASISHVDFSNYAAGVCRMVESLNDRAGQEVSRINAGVELSTAASIPSLGDLGATMGGLQAIQLGVQAPAVSTGEAAAAYAKQA